MRIRTDDVVWQELDGELVILDLRRSVYLTTNLAGSSLAKLLIEDRTLEDLAEHLISEFQIGRIQALADAEAFADLFLSYYGPTHAAAAALSPSGRAALRADLVAHAESSAHPASPEDHLVIDWEFRIVTAERRA